MALQAYKSVVRQHSFRETTGTIFKSPTRTIRHSLRATMVVQVAFQSVVPHVGHTTLSSAHAVCKPAPCCGVPHGPFTPCGRSAPLPSRRAFVSGVAARTSFLPSFLPTVHTIRSPHTVRAAAEPTATTGKKVLADLLKQNAEFAKGYERTHSDLMMTRAALSTGQSPPVAVIACADSRVAPEIMFRARLGEIFVMRVAGNTATGPQVLGSLQYAVDVLGVKLVMVLGHTKCGAVAAACSGAQLPQTELAAHVGDIARHIDDFGGLHERVDEAVVQNVQAQVAFLEDDLVHRAVADPPLVVGAVYDIASGKVATVGVDVGAVVGA